MKKFPDAHEDQQEKSSLLLSFKKEESYFPEKKAEDFL